MTQQEVFRWKFGMKVKLQRIILNMSQTELAEKLGYADKSIISKIEKGNTEPPVSKIQEFADILQTSIAYLMGWEDVNALTPEEEQLISIFRQFQPERKQAALQMLSALLSTEKNNADTTVSA